MVATGAAQRTGVLMGSWPAGMPASGSFYREAAPQVENLGYELLLNGDHVFAHVPNADPVPVLATYAAVTDRILLGTGVLLGALREPVVAAKQMATIDYLSGGRLVLGVGVGGEMKQEWRAMGVPLAGRGRRLDEHLDLMRAFWSGDPLHFDGELRTVDAPPGTPSPVQAGGPPIWVGGRSDAALRRAARHQGWCAYSCSPRRVRASVEKIAQEAGGQLPKDFRISCVVFTVVGSTHEQARETAAEILGERYRQDFDRFLDAFCAVGTPDEVAAQFAAFREAGVQDLLVCPQVPADQAVDQLTWVADILALGRPEVPSD